MEKTKIGILGCGNISDIYLTNLQTVFLNTEVYAVCDMMEERAKEKAEKYNVPKVYTDMHKLFADKNVEIVLNLTTPKQHYAATKAALLAGKHVHCEKPLSINAEEGAELVALAKEKGLLLGIAPDTFMGGGLQTCRKLIDDGFIGTPTSATAYMICGGHESWHPDPEFYYEAGGGPMLDMGPYYVTALVSLLGSVKRLCGFTKKTYETRTITSEKKYGKVIPVEVDTFVSGLMEFEGGAVGSIITTFDVKKSSLPCIEICGTDGTLLVPDPNGFGGPVKLFRPGCEDFMEIPLTHGYAENSRGIGVADMASALKSRRQNRASGSLGYHVLEVMLGFETSSKTGRFYRPKGKVKRPAPMPQKLLKGEID